jgi:hypothetical protein
MASAAWHWFIVATLNALERKAHNLLAVRIFRTITFAVFHASSPWTILLSTEVAEIMDGSFCEDPIEDLQGTKVAERLLPLWLPATVPNISSIDLSRLPHDTLLKSINMETNHDAIIRDRYSMPLTICDAGPTCKDCPRLRARGHVHRQLAIVDFDKDTVLKCYKALRLCAECVRQCRLHVQHNGKFIACQRPCEGARI